MTTKRSKTIGAELAIFSLESRPTFWGAHLYLYEMEEDATEATARWVSVSDRIVQTVEFEISGSEYRFEDHRERLGLSCYGSWKVNVGRRSEGMFPLDAIDAGKLALQIEKAEQALTNKWGSPATPSDVLKRAIFASKARFLRVNSDYSGTGVDAQRCWVDIKGTQGGLVDCLISREMRHWRDILTERRSDLFAGGKVVVVV